MKRIYREPCAKEREARLSPHSQPENTSEIREAKVPRLRVARRVTPFVRRKERRYENRFGDTDNTRGATPSWVEEAREEEEKGEDRNL